MLLRPTSALRITSSATLTWISPASASASSFSSAAAAAAAARARAAALPLLVLPHACRHHHHHHHHHHLPLRQRLGRTNSNQIRFLSTSAPRRASPTPIMADSSSTSGAGAEGIITPDSLKATLSSKLHTTYIAIEDMSGGCGQAFNAIIVSPDFDKKSHLQRHRLVNNALKAEIAAIHAWTPRCLTPAQWEQEQHRS